MQLAARLFLFLSCRGFAAEYTWQQAAQGLSPANKANVAKQMSGLACIKLQLQVQD